jgi:hypothetical protein
MLGINYWAVLVTTLAAFAFSSVYYMVFGKARMKLLANEPGATADVRKVPLWKVALELGSQLRGHAGDGSCNHAGPDRRLAGRDATGHLASHRVSSNDPYGVCYLG